MLEPIARIVRGFSRNGLMNARNVMDVAIVLTILAAPNAAAEQEGSWKFDSLANYPGFGPIAWAEKTNAHLFVVCPPDLDRFEVSVFWNQGDIAGTVDIGPQPADISIKLDDGRVMTEQWVTLHRRMQLNLGASAVDFLQKMLGASRLTVSTNFADGETRTESFDLTGLGKKVGLMAPTCEPIRSSSSRR